MKSIAFLTFAFALLLSGCASSGNLGKIGPDYDTDQTMQSGRVQHMHSSIQRGTW